MAEKVLGKQLFGEYTQQIKQRVYNMFVGDNAPYTVKASINSTNAVNSTYAINLGDSTNSYTYTSLTQALASKASSVHRHTPADIDRVAASSNVSDIWNSIIPMIYTTVDLSSNQVAQALTDICNTYSFVEEGGYKKVVIAVIGQKNLTYSTTTMHPGGTYLVSVSGANIIITPLCYSVDEINLITGDLNITGSSLSSLYTQLEAYTSDTIKHLIFTNTTTVSHSTYIFSVETTSNTSVKQKLFDGKTLIVREYINSAWSQWVEDNNYYTKAETDSHIDSRVANRLRQTTTMSGYFSQGEVVQYIGATTSGFIFGHFYKYNNGSWSEVEVSSSEASILMYVGTRSQIKSLRDNSLLVPGCKYRINDYQCTSISNNTSIANVVFDIILTADSTNVLNHKALAVEHEGTSIAGENLAAWELFYDIDNDTTKYAWADSTSRYSTEYFRIIAQDSEMFVQVFEYGSTNVSLEYSFNGLQWQALSLNTNILLTNIGDSVYLRRNSTQAGQTFSIDSSSYIQIVGVNGKKYSVSGNLMSLINYQQVVDTIPGSYCFYKLFEGRSVVDARGLYLPATTLTSYCYANMFEGCTSLNNAPTLYASVAAEGCYKEMFKGCTSLSYAPAIKINTPATSCCQSMFQGCTSLTSSPEIRNMVDVVASNCFASMFDGCTSMTTLTLYLEDWINGTWFTGWVNNVAANGTVYAPQSIISQTSTSYLPSGWLKSLNDHEYVEPIYPTPIITIEEVGKGVIYYMKDSKGNEAGYDFKNILVSVGGVATSTIPSTCSDVRINSSKYSGIYILPYVLVDSTSKYVVVDHDCSYIKLGKAVGALNDIQHIHIHSGIKGSALLYKDIEVPTTGQDYTIDYYAQGSTNITI